MPELPEVETVCRQLRERAPALLGRSIKTVRVQWPRTVAVPEPDAFAQALPGMTAHAVKRHGKNIIIELRRAGATRFLLVHLRMSGRLDVVPRAQADSKHARVLFDLDQNVSLRFDDARKFGRIWLVDDPASVLGTLGPDALTVSLRTLSQQLRDRKSAIKSVLLDQHVVAGIGNIYADESLFRSRIHPTRSAATLSGVELKRLHAAMIEVLSEGIAANGASFDWVYAGGEMQANFRVYGRTDTPCSVCGRPIQRMVLGQRSTHYCAHCQPLGGAKRST